MEKLIVQRGGVPQRDYVDMANYIFGMNGVDSSFYKLLPKLFGQKRDPSAVTFFGMEDGKAVACVGAFPIDFEIMGEHVKAGGIGNVGVHPNYRSKGYMIACMEAALHSMIDEGRAFAVLSGVRHRYGHFGFEKCANDYQMHISKRSIAYVKGWDFTTDLKLKKVEKGDETLLDQIAALHSRRIYKSVRPREDFYDIAISWQASLYAFMDGDSVIGYAIAGKHGVLEFTTFAYDRVVEMLWLMTDVRWGLEYHIPPFDNKLAAILHSVAEGVGFGADICFSVFDWEKTLSLLYKTKASYAPLCDFETVVHIDGYRAPENLLIRVEKGVPSVEKTDREAEITFTHLQAMGAFFMNYSPDREKFSAPAAAALPLPVYVFEPDNV